MFVLWSHAEGQVRKSGNDVCASYTFLLTRLGSKFRKLYFCDEDGKPASTSMRLGMVFMVC